MGKTVHSGVTSEQRPPIKANRVRKGASKKAANRGKKASK